MDKLLTLLQKHDVRLSIAVYPWPDQIVDKDLDSVQVSYWKKWSEERNIDMINYFPCFVFPQATLREDYDFLDTHFFRGDTHWKKEGHDIIASEYLSFRNGEQPSCAAVY